jgi:hypothetical protein
VIYDPVKSCREETLTGKDDFVEDEKSEEKEEAKTLSVEVAA